MPLIAMILLVFEIISVTVLFLLAREKFTQELRLADDKDKLNKLLPIGFQAFALVGYKYGSRYEKRLETKLRELKGEKDSRTHLKLHMAQKSVLMMLSVIFITFVASQVEPDASFGIFALILLGTLFYVTDKQLDDRIKARRREIQLEFTEFLNKLVLLVNAGLTVQGALFKIVRDNKKDNSLYTELGMAIKEIGSGKSETDAYEGFAKRCRIPEVTMFVATLLQNLRKGNADLVPALRIQAASCWDNRKNIAKKMGEEASTKLIMPMIIIFIAILLMVVTPAVLQLNI